MFILVSGSLAYDRIMNFPGYFSENILPDKIHVLNVSFAVKNLWTNYGGTAGNIAYNLKLLGQKVVIISSAGVDFSSYKSWLQRHGIITRYIPIIKKVSTATAHIITDKADNQITAFYTGAMHYQGIHPDISLIKKSHLAIVSPGNIDDMIELCALYNKHKLSYIFDPGQQITTFPKKYLEKCIMGARVFIGNDYEVSLVLKKISSDKKKLLKKVEIIVTTLGRNGSIIETCDKMVKIPAAKPKNISDPTGAGDAYRAGFIIGLVCGYPLEKCGKLASTIAVYTVEKYGTQTHHFTWRGLSRRFKENFKEKL